MPNNMKSSTLSRCLLLVCVWISVQCQADIECPVTSPGCECREELIVDCRYKEQLTAFPTILSQPNTSIVYDEIILSNNLIQTIPAKAFGGVRFKVIEILENGAGLSTIDDQAFSGNEGSLVELSLHLRQSAHFPSAALRILNMLQSLTITNFGYKQLPEDALGNLTSLENLTLTGGKLASLLPDDFKSQVTSLKLLNIFDNNLISFPSDAISSLTGLLVLNIGSNNIQQLGKNSVQSSSLEHLDMSSQQLMNWDETSFSGVAKSLQTLIMTKCRLTDRHAAMLSKLTSLVYLDISYNNVTNLLPVIDTMPLLVRLYAKKNSIFGLTHRTFQTTNKLFVIDLSNNTLMTVEPDTFSNLENLEQLNLEYDFNVRLDSNSFASQRKSLTFLNLNYADLSVVQWSPFERLAKLTTLLLEGCQLGDMPDSPFAGSHQLQSLQINNNLITTIRQKSLTGLEASLTSIRLDDNKISTVDQCAFYGFQKLRPISVKLKNNPLICDCSVKFMYDWMLNEGADTTLVDWKCTTEEFVWSLLPANFSTCNQSVPADICRDLTATTTDSPDGIDQTPTVGVEPGLNQSQIIVLLVAIAAVGSLLVVGVPLIVCNRIMSRRARQRLKQEQEAEPKQTINTKKFTRRPTSFSTDLSNDNKLTPAHRLQSRSLDVLQSSDTEAAMKLLTTLLRNRQHLAASLGNLDDIRYHDEPVAREYIESEIYDEINEADDDKTCLATDTV